MYGLYRSNRFKKDFKKINKNSNFNHKILEHVLNILIQGENLGEKYRNHKLHGEFNDCHECHIQPNILFIYKIDKENLIISLLRIGSHSELF